MDADSLRIIETYFKDETLLPLVDAKGYNNIPNSFWKDIEKQIKTYDQKHYTPQVFFSLFELVTSELISPEEVITLFSQIKNKPEELADLKTNKTQTKLSAERFLKTLKENPESFTNLFLWMTDVLKAFLKENHYGHTASRTISEHNQAYAYFKRRTLRLAYGEYDADLSKKFYEENPIGIKYPIQMLDRVLVMAYSTDFLTFKPNVKATIAENTISEDTAIERLMYDKQKMIEEGFSFEEIDRLMPEDIDEKFSLMETRSISAAFNLKRKAKECQDGSGKALMWHTEGATYRLRYNPPKGAPISLAVIYNVQRIVYNMMIQKYPEVEEAYKNELLEETNFIPLGYEMEYLEFEKQVIEDIGNKTVDFYIDALIEKLNFNEKEVLDADIKINISQLEICWNQPLMFDSFTYLHEKTAFFVKSGLETTALHGETPLMVSKIYSDISPNEARFAFKNYKKTKRILRNEIVLGNELKTRGLKGRETLSDMFLRDCEAAKRFVYSKFILQYLRATEGLNETEYEHGYNKYINMRTEDGELKKRWLRTLVEKADIPKEFKDPEFFEVFTDQIINSPGYIRRPFFRFLSDKQFRRLVVDSDNFERRGRGKYRLNENSHLFRIACDYRNIRNLEIDNKKAINQIYTDDNQHLKG